MTGLGVARVFEFLPVAGLLTTAAVASGLALRGAWRTGRGWAPTLCLAMVFAGMTSYALHRPRLAAWDQLPPREVQVALRINRVFEQSDARRRSGLATIVTAAPHLHELVGQRIYFSLSLPANGPEPMRSAVLSALGVLAPLPRAVAADSFDAYLANAGVNFRLTRGRFLVVEQAPNAYQQFCARMAARFAAILGTGVAAKQPGLVGVLRAMLLGQQQELSPEQELRFRESGTMHVFSISGLHIGVIAAGLQALLTLLRLPGLARFLIGLGTLWLYVGITGSEPSAVRAFIMVALLLSAFVLRVPGNPLAALTASALLVLLVAPLQFFSASFQMSYGIVAALLLIGLPLAERWQAAWPVFALLPKPAWRWHHRIRDWLWRWTLMAVAIGVAASLVSTVTGVLFFQLFTPGALLANLLLIPASTFVILAGFGSLLCGLVGFTTGTLLANHAAVLALWLIEHGIRGFTQLPGMWFTATFKAPWMGALTLAALLVVLLMGYARGWRGWRWFYWPPFAVVALGLLLGATFG